MLLAFSKDSELESTYILEYFVKISVRKIPSSAIAGSERVYALKILINIAQGVSKRGCTNLIYFESFTLVSKEGPGLELMLWAASESAGVRGEFNRGQRNTVAAALGRHLHVENAEHTLIGHLPQRLLRQLRLSGKRLLVAENEQGGSWEGGNLASSTYAALLLAVPLSASPFSPLYFNCLIFMT